MLGVNVIERVVAVLGTAAAVLFVLAAILFSGCDSRRPASSVAVPPPAAAVPAPPASEHPPAESQPQPTDCPGGVAGARTRVTDIANGVRIVITAKDRKAQEEIRKRANRIASVRQLPADATSAPTTRCLVAFYSGTETAVERIRGGIRVTVTVLKPEALDSLRAITRDRARAMTSVEGHDRHRIAAPKGST
jgi:hypothetical protein